MSEKFADPYVMEQNIRNVMDYWTTITQDDLTNFFNALRSDAWDEGYRDGHSDGLSDGHPLFNDREPEENPYRADRLEDDDEIGEITYE